jgi:hypothetical protein
LNLEMDSLAGLPGLGLAGLAGAFAVGLIFTQAAIAKLRHHAELAGVVANYRLLPEPLVAPIAAALPLVELALGLALLAGGLRLAVAPAALLLLVFAAAIAINLRRGRSHIDCGCGGPQLRQTLSWGLVGRNLALTALVSLRLLPAPAASGVDLATAIAGGAALFLVTLLFNAIGTLCASPLALRRS